MSEKVWFCKFFNERREFELVITGIKLFLRYLDHIVRTPQGNLSVVLQAANHLHPNLQYTHETPNGNGELTFSDFNLSLDGNKQVRWIVPKTNGYTYDFQL